MKQSRIRKNKESRICLGLRFPSDYHLHSQNLKQPMWLLVQRQGEIYSKVIAKTKLNRLGILLLRYGAPFYLPLLFHFVLLLNFY